MLEVYSKNITIAADAPITLNTVALLKGNSTIPLGASSILSTSFTTLVQVPESSNVNCPCSIPTVIDIFNDGIEATYNTLTVTIVRV